MAGPAYARSQRPSAFALSTALKPAGLIFPFSIRLMTVLTFFWDQILFGRRGVYLTNHQSSSNPFARPSIQPKQSAISTASLADTDLIPDFFLASFRYIPVAFRCSRSRKLSKSVGVEKVRIGRSVGGGFAIRQSTTERRLSVRSSWSPQSLLDEVSWRWPGSMNVVSEGEVAVRKCLNTRPGRERAGHPTGDGRKATPRPCATIE